MKDDNLQLEIGHVLFIDIVGYSKLLIEEQKERLHQLTAIVLGTGQVRASTDEQLVRLPTGDGMALVFRKSSEEPAAALISGAGIGLLSPALTVVVQNSVSVARTGSAGTFACILWRCRRTACTLQTSLI